MGTNTFTVTIDSLSFGGRGVGRRADGKTVFVPAVVPGEIVQACTIKEYPTYILATLDQVLEPSPLRVEPRCPLFPSCGGCDWQHIAYSHQVEWKRNILVSEIEKVCRSRPEQEIEPVQSDKTFGYRGHTVVQCTYSNGFSTGFFQKRSKRFIEFEECPILNPRIRDTLSGLREILTQNPIYGLYSLEIHAPGDDAIILARCKGTARQNDIRTMNRIYNDLDVMGVSFVMFSSRRNDYVLGQRFCRYDITVGKETVHLSSGFGGFIQANMHINTALIGHVMDLAHGSHSVLDLYSGSGNFSIPLSKIVQNVVAIERNQRVASQGRINAKKNAARNVRFLSMDVKKAVVSILNEGLSFDTVILDPPREGAKEIISLLPDSGASRIIYISCDPSTLSRDLNVLMNAGFTLRHTRVFDMFPQTYHIESVSFLER